MGKYRVQSIDPSEMAMFPGITLWKLKLMTNSIQNYNLQIQCRGNNKPI